MARSSRVRWRIIHPAERARQASAHSGAGSVESGVMLGTDRLGGTVPDRELDHSGDQALPVGARQLVAVEEQPQLPGAGGRVGKVVALGDVVVVQLRVPPGGGHHLVEAVDRAEPASSR
nr:hypothetical protein GCM10020092_069000 [Actinoplanes digitatis]